MNSRKHMLTLDSKSSLAVTAVDDVLSFDETLVSLSVGDSVLTISGDGLK